MRHIFIINPIAGGRDSTSRIMEAAKALQERHGIAYECILTRRPGHAMETCRALAEGGEARLRSAPFRPRRRRGKRRAVAAAAAVLRVEPPERSV